MTKLALSLLVVGAAAVVTSAQALGTREQNWQVCADAGEIYPADAEIVACTAILRSGVEEPKYVGHAFGNRGASYEKKGEYEAALRDYTRAIGFDPLEPLNYYNRGNLYSRFSQYERALQDLDRAIRLDPRYAAAHKARNVVLEKLGRQPRAIEDRDRALAPDPAIDKRSK